MAKKQKEELFERETRYCKIIRSVEIKDGDELFTLEKIYIKALERYEIRICLYRDCNDRFRKLIPIMNGIVNNMLKDKLDELEQVKVNIDLKIGELSVERTDGEEVLVTEEQIRNMFGRFKELVLKRNLPECKKFISDYVKDLLVYKDHVEVIFNVVFSFAENEINYKR